MVDLILTTFDRVPETPRGHVRDIRVRRAPKRPDCLSRQKRGQFALRFMVGQHDRGPLQFVVLDARAPTNEDGYIGYNFFHAKSSASLEGRFTF